VAQERDQIRDQSDHDAAPRADAEFRRGVDRQTGHDEMDAEEFEVEADTENLDAPVRCSSAGNA